MRKRRGYWTFEICKKEASKYLTKKDFNDGSPGAYNKARKSKWLNDICEHMSVIGNRCNRSVYVFEFFDNKAYIGISYNIEKRKNDHLTSEKSSVFKK